MIPKDLYSILLLRILVLDRTKYSLASPFQCVRLIAYNDLRVI